MSGVVACFSGSIGAGKSSVTHVLADALQWRRAGFGDCLRARILRMGGNPDSRQELQDLGQQLVESDPDAFCREVLASGEFTPGGNLLLDGMRHVDIYRRVQRLVAPSHAVLLHLSIDAAAARKRVQSRDGNIGDLDRARTHRVEAELAASLPSIADRVIDAMPSVHEISDHVLTVLAALGVCPEAINQARSRLT